MSGFDFDPEKPGKLDPRKYGFDYGDGGPIVFDSNLFRECPSCGGTGEIEIREEKKVRIEKCLICDGTGAVSKDDSLFYLAIRF